MRTLISNTRGEAVRRCACAVVCGLLLATFVCLTVARADDESLLETGRSAGRALLLLRAPWPCAIAVIRPRCQSDVARFFKDRTDADYQQIPKIGPHPISGLRDFLEHGDRGGLDKALAYINVALPPASLWASDARAATLFDVGTLQVLWPAALGNQAGQLFALGPAVDLQKNAARADGGALRGDLGAFFKTAASRSSGNAIPLASAASPLVDAIDRAYPLPPFPNVRYTDDTVGYARFGVVSAWVSEFIDTPPWLAQSDVLHLADEWTARGVDLAPAMRSAAQEFHDAIRARPFDHAQTLQRATSFGEAVVRSGSQARGRQMVAGVLAAQLTYNAAVLRDPAVSSRFLAVLSNLSELDAALPAFAHLRATAASISSDDWGAQFKLGNALISAIMSPDAAASGRRYGLRH